MGDKPLVIATKKGSSVYVITHDKDKIPPDAVIAPLRRDPSLSDIDNIVRHGFVVVVDETVNIRNKK